MTTTTAPTTPTASEDRRPRDAGVSLAELIVTIGLMALIGTLVATMATVSLRQAAGVQARLENTTQGEQAVAASGKVLRTAVLPEQLETQQCEGCASTAIITATSTKITFYAYVNDISVGPSLTTLEVQADPNRSGTGMLVQVTQPPTALSDGRYTFCTRGATSTSSCPFTTRPLARGLTWPSPGVFAYYDYDGAAIAGTAVPSSDLQRVASIDVVAKVQIKPGDKRFPSRTALTRVRLPNLEYDTQNQDQT